EHRTFDREVDELEFGFRAAAVALAVDLEAVLAQTQPGHEAGQRARRRGRGGGDCGECRDRRRRRHRRGDRRTAPSPKGTLPRGSAADCAKSSSVILRYRYLLGTFMKAENRAQIDSLWFSSRAQGSLIPKKKEAVGLPRIAACTGQAAAARRRGTF